MEYASVYKGYILIYIMIKRDEFGLTQSQKVILLILSIKKEITNIRHLGDIIGIKTYCQISKIVSELRDLFYLKKNKKGLYVTITITKKGEEIVSEMLEKLGEVGK